MVTRKSRIVATLLGSLVALLALEACLQVGSLILWWRHGAGAAARSGGRTVLCVGDSFTFGVGSSDPDSKSYPALLQQSLRRTHGEDWQVVQAGWPGRDSRSALTELGGWLEVHRPVRVYLAIGCNDRWTRPQEITLHGSEPSPDGIGWRFEWRTGRLLRWFLGTRGAASADSESAAEEARARAAYRAERSEANARTWGEALLALSVGSAEMERRFEEFPARATLRGHLAICLLMEGAVARGFRMLDSVLEQLPRDEVAIRARWLRVRAALTLTANPRQAGEDIVAAHALDGREFDQKALLALLDAYTPGRTLTTLASHLSQFVRRCRAAGAAPVLISYPLPLHRVNRTIHRVARAEAVPVIDLLEEFGKRVPAAELPEHFIADGHCSDRGYRVFAEVVLDQFERTWK